MKFIYYCSEHCPQTEGELFVVSISHAHLCNICLKKFTRGYRVKIHLPTDNVMRNENTVELKWKVTGG